MNDNKYTLVTIQWASWESLNKIKGIVYRIYCKVNNKNYIGKTKNTFSKRYRKKLLGHLDNCGLRNAIKKYGIHQFKINILFQTTDKFLLSLMETYYIKHFQSNNNKYGYNKTTGGEMTIMNPDVIERRAAKRRKTKHQFIKESIAIHNNLYNYDLVEYKNSDTKVIIKCNICNNIFYQTPSKHCLSGHGCTFCRSSYLKTTKQIILDFQKIHGNKYDYSLVNYKGARKLVEIICKKHGHFWQRPNGHLNGKQCRSCGYLLQGEKMSKIRKQKKWASR